jgi:transposase-like protein
MAYRLLQEFRQASTRLDTPPFSNRHHPVSRIAQPDRIGTAIFIPVTNAIERLHEEFKRRIKTQTVLPSAETAAMLFWALLASGQIVMRKVDGWQTLAEQPSQQTIDLAA